MFPWFNTIVYCLVSDGEQENFSRKGLLFMYKKILLAIFITALFVTIFWAFLSAHNSIDTIFRRNTAPNMPPPQSQTIEQRDPFSSGINTTDPQSQITPANTNTGNSSSSVNSSNNQGTQGYLSFDGNHLIWIQWKNKGNNNIEGTWHAAFYMPRGNTMRNFDVPFTGTLTNNTISINLHYSSLISIAATGTLNGNDLDIKPGVPAAHAISAHAASEETYERSLRELQAKH
jgi:hypothetical protein